MTRDEFIDMYCASSRITREHLLNWRRVLPCYCGDESCHGWATVLPEDEEHHMKTDGAKPE